MKNLILLSAVLVLHFGTLSQEREEYGLLLSEEDTFFTSVGDTSWSAYFNEDGFDLSYHEDRDMVIDIFRSVRNLNEVEYELDIIDNDPSFFYPEDPNDLNHDDLLALMVSESEEAHIEYSYSIVPGVFKNSTDDANVSLEITLYVSSRMISIRMTALENFTMPSTTLARPKTYN